MEVLDNEKVLHVASLAHIKINDNELEAYKNQLNDIVKEIKKIEDVNIDGDIMISSCKNVNCYKDDNVVEMNKRDEILKNAKLRNGDFIVVPRVLND